LREKIKMTMESRSKVYSRNPNMPYTQKRMAREIGLSEPTLSRIMSGAQAPCADHLIRIMDWLGDYNLRQYATWDPEIVTDARLAEIK
jgi:transcriptional regulator with XRE-family HTH domain